MIKCELCNEEIPEYKKAFRRYVDILSTSKYNRLPTPADIDHSSLLGRLLNGGPVFEYPPLIDHSYPNVPLALGEVVATYKPQEVEDCSSHLAYGGKNLKILDISDTDMLLKDESTGYRYRFWKMPDDDKRKGLYPYLAQQLTPSELMKLD